MPTTPDLFPQQPIDPQEGQAVQVTILNPETAAAQPTPAQQLGLVDGEFQVLRKPAEGETEGHIETGWTIRDVVNKREEDGSSHPVVVIEKRTPDDRGLTQFIDEKTVDLDEFMGWQPADGPESSTPSEALDDLHADEVLASEAVVETANLLANPEEAERAFMKYEETAEDLGEFATAEVVEEPPVDSEADEITQPESETLAQAAETSESNELDLRSVFASGESIEAALNDPALSPENRQRITAIAEHWKETFGVVKAIEQAWGEDLMPTVQKLMQQLPDSTRSMQQLRGQTEQLADTLSRIGTAHANRDSASVQGALRQLDSDMAIPLLRAAARRFEQSEELLQAGRRLGVQNEVAFEKVNHARHNKQLTPRDFQDLAHYAQPRLTTSGQGLRELVESMETDTQGVISSWRATEGAINEVAAMFAHLPLDDVSQELSGLTRSLEHLFEPSNTDYVWNVKQKAVRTLDSLQSVQKLLYKIQVETEHALSTRRR